MARKSAPPSSPCGERLSPAQQNFMGAIQHRIVGSAGGGDPAHHAHSSEPSYDGEPAGFLQAYRWFDAGESGARLAAGIEQKTRFRGAFIREELCRAEAHALHQPDCPDLIRRRAVCPRRHWPRSRYGRMARENPIGELDAR